MTEIYRMSTPEHRFPNWHESRAHMDAGYSMELVLQIPMAAWILYLFATRDPARHQVETFLSGLQMAGAIGYYLPGLVKGEVHCWLSVLDRLIASVWVIYPFLLLRRNMAAARKR